MMKLNILAAAVALAFAGAVSAQSTPSATDSPRKADTTTRADRAPAGDRSAARKTSDAEEERIEAAYKADKEKCDGMKGNAKDVCQKEAKGKEKVAKAELDAKKDPSERNQRKVKEAKAEAEYEVAKEKCDDMKGNEKNACQKDAKAQRDRLMAEAKGSGKTASRGASTGSAPSTGSTAPAPRSASPDKPAKQ